MIIHRSSQLTAVGKEKERKKVIIARPWMLEGWSLPQHIAVYRHPSQLNIRAIADKESIHFGQDQKRQGRDFSKDIPIVPLVGMKHAEITACVRAMHWFNAPALNSIC